MLGLSDIYKTETQQSSGFQHDTHRERLTNIKKLDVQLQM
jgi:hypothetical protein